MAGINVEEHGASDDVPDSYIGRFIDRLDAIQFKMLQPLSRDFASAQSRLKDQDQTISQMQKTVRQHSRWIAEHDLIFNQQGGETQHRVGGIYRPIFIMPVQPSQHGRGVGHPAAIVNLHHRHLHNTGTGQQLFLIADGRQRLIRNGAIAQIGLKLARILGNIAAINVELHAAASPITLWRARHKSATTKRALPLRRGTHHRAPCGHRHSTY